MTDLEIILAATRYEKLRKLDPREYTLLWGDSLFTDTPFDELVDGLPEPFRTKLKEEPKTCQTCKHWEAHTEKVSKFLSSSTRECKEIFKCISADNDDLEELIPFFDSFDTKATFGCNKHEQKEPTDGNL